MANRDPSSALFAEYHEQTQCALFAKLPPEIRYEIFAYALATAPDRTSSEAQNSYCVRPGYENRRRTWTQLLRTCKRVYMEAWFMPLACSEHAFYMTGCNRCPKRVTELRDMQHCLDLLYKRHGEVHGGSIRLFTQMYKLEGATTFQGIFAMPHFQPTTVAITIRYTDTWFWEDNHPLRIKGSWCEREILPASVSCFQIEIESIERRKAEVDYIATEAANKWHFTRSDGAQLLSDPSQIAISRWTGSSFIGGDRWIRDEVRPGQLDYYVATITWRPSPDPLGSRPEKNPNLRVDWDRPAPRQLEYVSIPEEDMVNAGIPADSTPEDASKAYYAFCHKSLMIIPS